MNSLHKWTIGVKSFLVRYFFRFSVILLTIAYE